MAGTSRQVSTDVRVLSTLETVVRVLAVVLALSLLVVGTVALIAELKGTWHWAIHLESTISYIGIFVTWVLALLVPGFVLLLVGRWMVDDA
jgi:hypothetical protein